MPKYYCTVIIDASVNIEIEADSPEEAADKAMEHDRSFVTLCHQCSRDLDTGDAIRVIVCDQSGDCLLYTSDAADE